MGAMGGVNDVQHSSYIYRGVLAPARGLLAPGGCLALPSAASLAPPFELFCRRPTPPPPPFTLPVHLRCFHLRPNYRPSLFNMQARRSAANSLFCLHFTPFSHSPSTPPPIPTPPSLPPIPPLAFPLHRQPFYGPFPPLRPSASCPRRMTPSFSCPPRPAASISVQVCYVAGSRDTMAGRSARANKSLDSSVNYGKNSGPCCVPGYKQMDLYKGRRNSVAATEMRAGTCTHPHIRPIKKGIQCVLIHL